MNYATGTPDLAGMVAYDRSHQFLDDHDADRLEAFYLGLDFDHRRRRFGGGASDHSIAQYCRTVDWQRTIVIARGSAHGLDAVLEIHPLSQQWDRAEIVMTCALEDNRSRILAELLQLAALTAGGRGCSRFVMYLNAGCSEEIGLLAGIGRSSCDRDVLSVDIFDYGRNISIEAPDRACLPAENLKAVG